MAVHNRDDMGARAAGGPAADAASDTRALRWHIAMAGNAHGPFTLQQMHAFRHGNRLAPDTFVHCEGWPDWRRVAEVSELNAAPSVAPRVPLLTRRTTPVDITPAQPAQRRPTAGHGAPPPLHDAMGHDPFAIPDLDDDPVAASEPASRWPSTGEDTPTSAMWDLDAMPDLESLAASSRVRRAKRELWRPRGRATPTARSQRPPTASPRPNAAASGPQTRAGLAVGLRNMAPRTSGGAATIGSGGKAAAIGVGRGVAGAARQLGAGVAHVAGPDGARRLLGAAAKRAQAVVASTAAASRAMLAAGQRLWGVQVLRPRVATGVVAVAADVPEPVLPAERRAPGAESDREALATRQEHAAARGAALAVIARRGWAYAVLTLDALRNGLGWLLSEERVWLRGLRRAAALRLAGVRVGALSSIVLSCALAAGLSFIGSNVLTHPSARRARIQSDEVQTTRAALIGSGSAAPIGTAEAAALACTPHIEAPKSDSAGMTAAPVIAPRAADDARAAKLAARRARAARLSAALKRPRSPTARSANSQPRLASSRPLNRAVAEQ